MATRQDPFDPAYEQEAFLRELDPTRPQTQPMGQPASLVEPPPAVPAPAAAGPVGNGVDAREALGGYAGVGTMRGFNTARDYGGDQKAGNSVKNTFGRIASRYQNSAGGLDALMQDPDFLRYFPNATRNADKINFGGVLSDFESGTPVNDVDVLEALDGQGNSSGWQWLDQAGAGQGGGGTSTKSMVAPSSDLFTAIMGNGGLAGNDTLEQIQREIQALMSGQPSDVSQQAFLQALR